MPPSTSYKLSANQIGSMIYLPLFHTAADVAAAVARVEGRENIRPLRGSHRASRLPDSQTVHSHQKTTVAIFLTRLMIFRPVSIPPARAAAAAAKFHVVELTTQAVRLNGLSSSPGAASGATIPRRIILSLRLARSAGAGSHIIHVRLAAPSSPFLALLAPAGDLADNETRKTRQPISRLAGEL